MNLQDLHVNGFRSVSDATLGDCGELNVLIGKNNSGKSNILTAIKFFFDFFKDDGSVATTSPDVHKATDVYGRKEGGVVSVTGTLRLTEGEVSDLKEGIATEAPQVRNALFASDLGNEITVRLNFTQSPFTTGYISWIGFGSTVSVGSGTIFAMDGDSAGEIALRLQKKAETFEEINAIEALSTRLDSEYWPRNTERSAAGGMSPMARRVIEQIGVHVNTLTRLVRSADSHAAFQRACADRVQTLKSHVSEMIATPIEHPVTTFSGDATEVPEYVSALVRQFAELRVHHLSEQRRPIGQQEAARILKLKTSRGQGDVLRGLQAVVSGLLGVQIDAFSSDDQHFRRGLAVAAELDVDEFLVQVNGSGIREALRLILDYEFEKPQIMLVEEPEVHLHPALETALMQYLKNISKDCQIFITTHSTNFLDVGSLRNVYMIRKDPATRVQLLNVAEAEEAIPQELGIRLSALFMYDRLTFVEGPSDEQVLRSFADTLNVSFGQAALGFVTTGGARNFTHYATASTLSFLGKRNVKTVFVLDRDERDERDLQKLESQISGISELKLLSRRELENYLLSAPALAKFIPVKSQGRANPSEEEIGAAIEEICDSLMAASIERRVLKVVCAPLYPDRKSVIDRGNDKGFLDAVTSEISKVADAVSSLNANLESLVKAAEDEVRGDWETRKRDIVPGEEVLTLLFQRYGLRFNKRQDGGKIAALMESSEIPGEIASIVRGLVQ
ncbi:AAA family ATPase [Streptomyces griseus]|uniref:AAA family ATPase n=1 Tax=Streptomyces griseus TaxID=1911 RepID=UPI0009971B51|nr:AAA family ATPase [Streptomyces griseus]